MGEARNYNWISFLVGVILVVGGIFALSNPDATYMTLAAILGIVIILCGIMLIASYYRLKEAFFVNDKVSLTLGIVLVIIGVFFLSRPVIAVSIFAYILAIWLILNGINHLTRSGSLKNFGRGIYTFITILNILLIIGAIILIFHPIILGLTIALIIGLLLLIYGTLFIFFTFLGIQYRV